MNPLREYDIAFVGLKEGIHNFDYQIGSSFFSLFEGSPINECNIHVKLSFDKKKSFFLLHFQVSGTLQIQCSRCNADLDYPIDADYNMVVKLGELPTEKKDEDDDVIYLGKSDTHLNVAQLIYEYAVLAIPSAARAICSNIPGKKCDPEVLRILNELSENKEHKETDPRWAELKKLKFK